MKFPDYMKPTRCFLRKVEELEQVLESIRSSIE